MAASLGLRLTDTGNRQVEKRPSEDEHRHQPSILTHPGHFQNLTPDPLETSKGLRHLLDEVGHPKEASIFTNHFMYLGCRDVQLRRDLV